MYENFGKTGKDTITGFKGVATARIEYMTGCNQVMLQPPVNEKGEHVKGEFFDESRIEFDDATPVKKLPEDKLREAPGFDAQVVAPSRRV